MIAASEPLEFVPHGRTVIAKHPGQIYGKGQNISASENSLLYKLTNFAIKDESLLEAKEADEHEWWCIREVYYRNSGEIEDDLTQAQKDLKNDYNSESFRPPSRLKNDFNISIKSELLGGVKKMDTECVNSAGPSRAGSANSSSNMSKKFHLNNGLSKSPKKRPLNPKTDSSYEEELYVKGCTAVWSKGLISTPATKVSAPEYRETICCYTLENPIKHAAFCNFHININNTMLIDALNSQIADEKKNIKIEDTTEHIPTKVMPAILLMDNKCMQVFATDGREYINNVPFQVKKVWPIKYGVLLEKQASPMSHNSILPSSFLKLNESHNSTLSRTKTNYPFNMSARLRAESVSGYDLDVPLPTCFSLSHPLDEVTPILMKSPSVGLQYYNDGDLQIVFVSVNPSIILLYDWKLAIHSLWKIRKALRDECLTMCPNINSTTTLFSQSCDYLNSPMNTHSNIGKNATSWATGLGSPYQSKKGPSTPTFSRSRQNSPMANIFHQQGLSPHASIGQASCTSMMANTMMQTPPSLPLYPDICLEHIWTDTQQLRRDRIDNPADMKTFLHTDLVGHEYLCFIVKTSSVSRLQIIRLQKSHSHGQPSKSNLIVGAVSSVLAKDAVVLDHLNMIALIDESGNIILQSGNSMVGKVHVGGVLARLIDSPYTKPTFQSPFPRRSSLLPSRCNDASAFDDSALHLLSPVPHSSASRLEQKESLGLSGLCDAAGSRMTLQFDSGVMYRISLPTISCSDLVTRCCAALKAILPKDITMQVIIRWYGSRNAPGTQDLTPEQEWSMFSNLLFFLMGYDVEKLSQSKQSEETEHTEVATKKQRTSSDGSHEDWEYLLNSKLHKTIGNSLASMLHIQATPSSDSKTARINRLRNSIEMEKPSQFNTNALLFPYTIQVLYAFHLVYEETKLNTILWTDLRPLSGFLYQISKDLKLECYVNHYWLDFPTDYDLDIEESNSQVSEATLQKLIQPTYFTNEPPHILNYLNCMLQDKDAGYYPYLTDVNNMSRDLIEILTIVGVGRCAGVQTVTRRDSMAASTPRGRRDCAQYASPYCQAVGTACERGITPRDVDNLPPAIGLLVLTIFSRCKSEPPVDWPVEAYNLIMREDLALQAEIAEKIKSTSEYLETLALEVLEKETAYSLNSTPHCQTDSSQSKNDDNDTSTGMEHLNSKLLGLLYPRDHRMTEVFNLLQSSIPVTINLTQRPEVSDHDFIEEQEKHLFAISTRTMALPIARGMLTLRSLPCAPTEPLTLPKLCVTGRGPPPRCNTINLGSADASPQCLLWPTFHNGVAAGLALVPMTGSSIDSSWVIYNKPRGTQEMSTEHAGFLMALGLNGHLRDMPFMNMYEYLVKCHEMISVGLLLGLAATYRGTMDVQATKMMSIHLEPLLPPTSIELDIQQNILVAALLGVGLIYQDTGHIHYAQVLLNEIGKPPGPEMENCVEREGYALAAGLALGFVCVRAGSNAPDHIAQRLRTYMLGGDKHPLTGATVALGLMYLRSNNAALAGWLRAPATAYQLDYVRPDLLMLRIIARGLVLWDSIEATEEWIEEQVPASIKPYCFVKPTEDHIDYEAMNQAYCNIIAGACFAVGLRFAGSGDEDARDAVMHFVRLFLALGAKSVAELAGRSTLEACLCVCLLAAGMIMAGRGDIQVLRVCRRMRARVPSAAASPATPATPTLTHGGQMAVHCTIGLLFLGGGRATLSTTPTAIAALLAAFFPKFPTHSEDNRYHLQAFRHLYVLAVEPRLILPRDISNGKICYAHVQLVDLSGVVKEVQAPCILPELDTLKEVKINDPRYWPITFQRDRNWDQLKTFLEYTWCIDIKQRAGCLSYLDDPHGFLTILAQTLTLDKANIWSATADNIELFTNDDQVRNFVKHYLYKDHTFGTNICADCLLVSKKRKGVKNEPYMTKQCMCRKYSKEEQDHVQGLSMVTYECVVKDILCALPIWTTFLKIIKTMKTEPSTYHMWQIKLLLSQIDNYNKRTMDEMKIDGQDVQNEPLISTEFTLAIKQRVGNVFDGWEIKIIPYLRKYLGLPSSRKISSCEEDMKKILSSYLVYHDLPRGVLRNVMSDNELGVIMDLENMSLSIEALSKIELLLR
ncbi:anaphase-promoting complex subunit 1 isoform X2 [Ostrinia furnacalis]|uniref:anaphase-promoting complex subunit 1 isoform X2 n=1 Tax=Ostrinia furnacalis TaxID=93504 RepID=UPI00103B95B6|nr:anaphase-promoting complex subunit 1 isoform X2 [Ostrinia furnacalis]